MTQSILVVNAVAFAYILAKEINHTKSNDSIHIQKASAAILAIAMTQYAITALLLPKDPEAAQLLRYVDWLATTPLLLFTYWALAKSRGWNKSVYPLIVAVVAMVLLGYLAEQNNHTMFIASSLCYVYILKQIRDMQEMFKSQGLHREQALGNYFIIGWLAYPLAFYAADDTKYAIYTIADFINKGLYSLSLYDILQ